MRISIGSDHRGLEVKAALVACATALGNQVFDEGPCSGESVDYPDIGALVGHKVSKQEGDRGILICGTGIGMAITANKFAGVRAAVCNDVATAKICRQHNDANVLCLSGDLPPDDAGKETRLRVLKAIVQAWLETAFEGGRHTRRVEKIGEIEQREAAATCGK